MMSSAEAASLVPPIILVDGHDVMMFGSVAAAERFLEPWAVQDDSAAGFDAKGRKLAFYVEPHSQKGWMNKLFGTPPGRVRIVAAQGSADEATLKTVLGRYLSARKPDSTAHGSSKSLEELIAETYPLARLG